MKKSMTDIKNEKPSGVKKKNQLPGGLGVIDEMARNVEKNKKNAFDSTKKITSNKKMQQFAQKRPQSSQIKNSKNATRNTY